MKIDLGTINIKSDDWEIISDYFTRDEAREHMREIALADLKNEALGRQSVDDARDDENL